MKILLLTQFFSTTRGGGEYVFSMIAQSLANHGNKVWVITNKINDEIYPVHENIKIVFVEPILEYKGGLPPSFSNNIRYVIGSIKEGLDIIKRQKIDLIHSNNFSPALTGAILSRITSKPHITTVHDIFSLCGEDYWYRWATQNHVSKFNALLAPFFEKLLVKLGYSAIHTVSEATRMDLEQFGTKKPIYVIPNSIFEKELIGIQVNPYQFVYIGRLVFYKNLEVVIKAAEIVKETEKRIKLIIVGGGPHLNKLKELTKNLDLDLNIEFKGYVNEIEKSNLIASSNALVLPSLCEGFGLVILESFLQKRPVLVSSLRPMSDIVTHGSTGFVLDPHNEHLWASHFLKLIENPGLASTMGQNGKKILFSQYDQNSMYQKLLKMYNDHIKK